jgi:hypothetical protein
MKPDIPLRLRVYETESSGAQFQTETLPTTECWMQCPIDGRAVNYRSRKGARRVSIRAATSATVLGRVKRWVFAMLARKEGLRVALLPRRRGAFDPLSAS